jgi:hypothetical protein
VGGGSHRKPPSLSWGGSGAGAGPGELWGAQARDLAVPSAMCPDKSLAPDCTCPRSPGHRKAQRTSANPTPVFNFPFAPPFPPKVPEPQPNPRSPVALVTSIVTPHLVSPHLTCCCSGSLDTILKSHCHNVLLRSHTLHGSLLPRLRCRPGGVHHVPLTSPPPAWWLGGLWGHRWSQRQPQAERAQIPHIPLQHKPQDDL